MKIVINIQNKHVILILLFIIAASAATIVFGYGSSNPPIMGHSWGEIECSGCISTSNLADNSVTSAKIQDGTITTSDVSTIDGSKITGSVPYASSAGNADTLDGYHASSFIITCPCGTCWNTRTGSSDVCTFLEMCTPAGWKATTYPVCNYP